MAIDYINPCFFSLFKYISRILKIQWLYNVTQSFKRSLVVKASVHWKYQIFWNVITYSGDDNRFVGTLDLSSMQLF